jgi:toxin ParE1/3/4
MRDYIVAPEAQRDMLEIWGFIAVDDIATAEKVEAEFYQAFRSLARMPGLGHRREDLAPEDLLFWKLYSYLIIYKHIGNHIRVVAVLHGRRDVREILSERMQ